MKVFPVSCLPLNSLICFLWRIKLTVTRALGRNASRKVKIGKKWGNNGKIAVICRLMRRHTSKRQCRWYNPYSFYCTKYTLRFKVIITRIMFEGGSNYIPSIFSLFLSTWIIDPCISRTSISPYITTILYQSCVDKFVVLISYSREREL